MRRLSTGWSNLLPCSHALTSAIELNSFCNLREDFMMADGRGGGLATVDPVGPRPQLDPGLVAQGDELRSALDAALAKLTEKHREVFVLFTVKNAFHPNLMRDLGGVHRFSPAK